MLIRDKGKEVALACCRIDIAIKRRIVASIDYTNTKALGQYETNLVTIGYNIFKDIIPIKRLLWSDYSSLLVIKCDGNRAIGIALIGILDSVSIGIDPNAITQRGFFIESYIQTRIILTRINDGDFAFERWAIDVAIFECIVVFVLRWYKIIFWHTKSYLVATGSQSIKCVAPVSSNHLLEFITAIIIESYGNAFVDVWLTIILNTVSIKVMPNPIAQWAVLVESHIPCEVIFAWF